MIQRLQSIFLALMSGTLASTFLLPYADSSEPIPNTLFADGFFSNSDNIILTILMALAALSALGAIFLYNNRQLQKNIVWMSIICLIGAVAFGIFYFMQQAPAMGAVAVDEEPGVIMPILGFILGFLAIRFITKDEKLVRSADRLR